MPRRKNREINVFGVSFMDVLSNTVGGLAFLLIIVFLLMSRRQKAADTPMIVTERLPAANCGDDYYVALSASRGRGVYSWEISGGDLPPGLEFDSQTGRLTGKVDERDIEGDEDVAFEFAATCKAVLLPEGRNAVSRAFQIKVIPPDRRKPPAPVKIVSGTELPASYGGQSYPLALASHGGVPPYSWTLDENEASLPQGLSLSSDGSFTGGPQKGQEGDYRFTAIVTGGNGTTDRRTFALEVKNDYPPPPELPPLKVATLALPDAVADKPYPLHPSAEGGFPVYTWKIVEGGVPWLTAAPDGKSFSGTPTYDHVGDVKVVLEVTDKEKATARSETLAFKVVPPGAESPEPLKLLTKMTSKAVRGEDFSFHFAACGGYLPYRWECGGLEAVSGLTFDPATGCISGVPGEVGEASLNVTVSDTGGDTAVKQFAFEIEAADLPLRILTEALPTALASNAYTIALSADGGHPPYKWGIESGALPAALALDDAGSCVSGVPLRPGLYPVAFNVTDAHGTAVRSKPMDLVVRTEEGCFELIVKTTEIPLLVRNGEASMALSCEGGKLPYRWSAGGKLPEGVTCADGKIVGIPRDHGDFALKLSVADGSGQTAAADVVMRIRRLLPWWWILVAAIVAAAAVVIALLMLRRPPVRPLRIVTKSIPNARASMDYCVQLACEGGRAPYKWSLASGELPPGLELSEDGIISGKPFEGTAVNDPVKMEFVVEVRDALGKVAKQEL